MKLTHKNLKKHKALYKDLKLHHGYLSIVVFYSEGIIKKEYLVEWDQHGFNYTDPVITNIKNVTKSYKNSGWENLSKLDSEWREEWGHIDPWDDYMYEDPKTLR